MLQYIGGVSMERVMELLSEFLKHKWILIVLIILLIYTIISLFRKSKKAKNIQAEISLLEIDYNTIKSTPLTFKLNKARSLAKVNELIKKDIEDYTNSYEAIQKAIERMDQIFLEAFEAIENDELEIAETCAHEISEISTITLKNVEKLNEKLDDVLKQELKLRSEITKLKDRYRTIKSNLNSKSKLLAFSEEIIDSSIENIEHEFKAFDEWMYISEFDKAEIAIDKIEANFAKLDEVLDELPELLPKAQEIIPNKIADVSSLYSEVLDSNIYLDHLDITTTLTTISQQLSGDLADLRVGKIKEVKGRLDISDKNLNELKAQLNAEIAANDNLVNLYQEIDNLNETIKLNNDKLVSAYDDLKARYNYSKFVAVIENYQNQFKDFKADYVKLTANFKDNTPVSEILEQLNTHYEDLNKLNVKLIDSNNEINNILSEEKRAHQQLLKLYLIINEVSTKINQYQLPSISNDYKEDVKVAKEYIRSIEDLLAESSLNLNLLNSTLDEAIDYIYRLYNNVNNIVGMAIMVENAIVFANRYRSKMPEVDSELIKSELYFRNGEYTQALTCVLAVIEKIHPEDYEQKIRENAINAI